ncbi:hypothetical protein M1394_02510 [Candidatus Marsarchaeota archaeon]|nr:hypothetical protein [Candidatus Marsarchaeota archaeon]
MERSFAAWAGTLILFNLHVEVGMVDILEDGTLGAGSLAEDIDKKRFMNSILSMSDLSNYFIASEIRRAFQEKYILAKEMIRLDGKMLEDALRPYFAAIVLLAYSGEAISTSKVAELVRSAGLDPERKIMEFVSALKIRNIFPYATAILFIKLLNREASLESIVPVINSIGIRPDISLSISAISEYESIAGEGQIREKIRFSFEKDILSLSAQISRLLSLELERTFSNKEIAEEFESFSPYLSALSLLIFTGRDSDSEGNFNMRGLSNILNSIGIKGDDAILNTIGNMSYGKATSVIYVPAIYLIRSAGKNPDVEKIKKIVYALQLPYDDAAAGYVLTVCNIE